MIQRILGASSVTCANNQNEKKSFKETFNCFSFKNYVFFLINHKMISIPSAKFHLHLTHLQKLTTTYMNFFLTSYLSVHWIFKGREVLFFSLLPYASFSACLHLKGPNQYTYTIFTKTFKNLNKIQSKIVGSNKAWRKFQ